MLSMAWRSLPVSLWYFHHFFPAPLCALLSLPKFLWGGKFLNNCMWVLAGDIDCTPSSSGRIGGLIFTSSLCWPKVIHFMRVGFWLIVCARFVFLQWRSRLKGSRANRKQNGTQTGRYALLLHKHAGVEESMEAPHLCSRNWPLFCLLVYTLFFT